VFAENAGRRRIRQFQRREIPGDFLQVVVGQVLDEIGHRHVVAAPVAKVLQLVEEVTRRLAGNARKVAIARSAPLAAMTSCAGLHALRQRVGYGVHGRRADRQRQAEGDDRCAQATDDIEHAGTQPDNA
jgi:hypothetical protein